MRINKKEMRFGAVPSFFSGMARALDIGSTLSQHDIQENGNLADARALFDDWQQVGLDIGDAMDGEGRCRIW